MLKMNSKYYKKCVSCIKGTGYHLTCSRMVPLE